MIVKFLRPSASFKGVSYSFTKILLDKGELMQVQNFHALQGLARPRPEDYVNYLEALTQQSKRIVYPQLHVTLSTSGRDHSKHELSRLAVKWLDGMGYGQQPFLIIFHKDTQNNHVHIVSTRVGRDGKKIKDSYEWMKGYEVLNQILNLDEGNQVKKDISHALTYHFSSRAQFMMLLEIKGYSLLLNENNIQISKFGKVLDNLSVHLIDQRIADNRQNKERIPQLRAIINKYRQELNPELYPVQSQRPGGKEGPVDSYTSDLAKALHERFGLQFFFHAGKGKQPYGYTVIDHAQRTVFKGGQLMPLAELLTLVPSGSTLAKRDHIPLDGGTMEQPAEVLLPDPGSARYDHLDEHAGSAYAADTASVSHMPSNFIPTLRLNIADDIDDEQINGRNRRRKRKSRTNTR
ncbi:relaxase/mobilization nuclease domain-containing protein [Mucilaginibacter lacusdianchii]|uniref:relaxase/mobilization nuclease domain-containing protein n=1 Tax=Mucilaginibacter lacusdianchii TaxID=2684211 RepID=UPI00131A758B|nr:relaxase/mobilization nuclease domain-containing protein [Mucilaginibacter sp. JXJ CY 39]